MTKSHFLLINHRYFAEKLLLVFSLLQLSCLILHQDFSDEPLHFIMRGIRLPTIYLLPISVENMGLKCIAIDKESSSLSLISNYIRLFPGLELLKIFSDIQAAEEFVRNNSIDLVFIELSMPFDAAIRRIRMLQEKLLVIFTVNGKQLPTDILKLDVVDYLVKPFAYLRFAKAVGKAMSLREKVNAVNPESPTIYIRSTYELIRVDLNEVEYIESVENYIRIYFTSGKFIMALMPLKKILEKIPPEKFVRIHRSYIIAIDKIKNIRNKKVTLNIAELPAGDSYFKNLKELIK